MRDLPIPVEEKLVFIDVFEATGLWIRTPAANSHFPLPKSKGFCAFLKDWRQEAAAGHGMKFQIAGERKCLTFIP